MRIKRDINRGTKRDTEGVMKDNMRMRRIATSTREGTMWIATTAQKNMKEAKVKVNLMMEMVALAMDSLQAVMVFNLPSFSYPSSFFFRSIFFHFHFRFHSRLLILI